MIQVWLVDGTHRLQADPQRTDPLPPLPEGNVALAGVPSPGDDIVVGDRKWRVERVEWPANGDEPRVLVA
jgi:hypothetical protein